MATSFNALRTYKIDGLVVNKMEHLHLDDLGAGEVVIKTAFSSINYKDALGISGKGSIYKKFPIIGGIDVSGVVESSQDAYFLPGDRVLVTGCNFGEAFDGGFSEYVRVPAQAVVKIPDPLSLRDVMIYGTAAFTAALCLHRMETNGQKPDRGPIVVTGASGGVGSFATALFAGRGYEVIAISSKGDRASFLRELGAAQVLLPTELKLGAGALEKGRFGGAVDNVGGTQLAGLLASTNLWGNVASVGLAQSHLLSTTVMPFILRGVSLLGISSNNCEMKLRYQIWKNLAGDWKISQLERFVSQTIGLEQIESTCHDMIEQKTFGRILVSM